MSTSSSAATVAVTSAAAAAAAAAAVAAAASNSSSSSSSLVVPAAAAATAAAAAAAACTLGSSIRDELNRRWLLSAQELQKDRQEGYQRAWKAKLLLAEQEEERIQQREASATTATSPSTIILKKQAEVDELVQQMVRAMSLEKEKNKKARSSNGTSNGEASSSSPESLPPMHPKRMQLCYVARRDREFYLWLRCEGDKKKSYQLPVTTFGRLFADRLQDSGLVSNKTFCFVVDAAAGMAAELIADMVGAVAGLRKLVRVCRDPLWLVTLAAEIADGKGLSSSLSDETLEKIIWSCCQLEAAAAGGVSAEQTTVVITIPTAIAPVVMPLLQKAYPADRHVFAYTGCCRSLVKATSFSFRGSKHQERLQRYQFRHPAGYSVPLSSKVTDDSRNIVNALQALSLRRAAIVQCWVGAVDAFFQLKEEEKVNDYLPYVCKLDYLYESPSLTRTANIDPKLLVEGSDRYSSLLSLLQYVTGTKSRPLPEDTIWGAVAWLRGQTETAEPPLDGLREIMGPEHYRVTDNVVFQHKSILLENKTLKDTVLPAQHWTLKQAMKKGCACCAPEEEEEDEEDDDDLLDDDEDEEGTKKDTTTTITNTTTKKKTAMMMNNGGYVDGKTTFAFDPTLFSK